MSNNEKLCKNRHSAASFVADLSKMAGRAEWLGLYKTAGKMYEAVGAATSEMADEIASLHKQVEINRVQNENRIAKSVGPTGEETK